MLIRKIFSGGKYNFNQHRHWQFVTTVTILAWERTPWKVLGDCIMDISKHGTA